MDYASIIEDRDSAELWRYLNGPAGASKWEGKPNPEYREAHTKVMLAWIADHPTEIGPER